MAAGDCAAQETTGNEIRAAVPREASEHGFGERNLIGARTAAMEVADSVDTLAEAVEHELIHTVSADEDVAPLAADEDVVPVAALELVAAIPADERVVARLAE